MNPFFEQIKNIYLNMPLSRKIATGAILFLVIMAFGGMFIWANKVDYRPLFTNLNQEDAAVIIEKLKEKRIPYKIEGDGNVISIPEKKVYDLRLELAAEGLPKGGFVGYEIFDNSEFGTTEFVQKLNRQRAIQGELARTIQSFEQVDEAKVMIVLPKDSVFIEETKPATASVLLKLNSDIGDEKVESIVHLVASSVEDLTPKEITVVDTTGRVLFKHATEEEQAEKLADERATTQLKYKAHLEKTLTQRIQTMLERIVGTDNAIVRVSADLDFSEVSSQEEIYDPDERNAPFVRSRKNSVKSMEKQGGSPGMVSSVNPIVPPDGAGGPGVREKCESNDDVVNYELSKILRQKIKPLAVLTRLSVAAVVDGTYSYEVDKDGKRTKKYIPRTTGEMAQFRQIVEKAMGYDENRGDQVTVESFAFTHVEEKIGEELTGVQSFVKDYGRTAANLILILVLFIFVVRPLIKAARDIQAGGEDEDLPLLDKDGMPLLSDEQREAMLPEPEEMTVRERAAYLAEEDLDRSANVLRAWLSEAN